MEEMLYVGGALLTSETDYVRCRACTGRLAAGRPRSCMCKCVEMALWRECRVGRVRALYLVLVRRKGAHLTRHL
mgnify:CR=1 FL=1